MGKLLEILLTWIPQTQVWDQGLAGSSQCSLRQLVSSLYGFAQIRKMLVFAPPTSHDFMSRVGKCLWQYLRSLKQKEHRCKTSLHWMDEKEPRWLSRKGKRKHEDSGLCKGNLQLSKYDSCYSFLSTLKNILERI